MSPPLDAFFQPAPEGGQRLCLHHMPSAGQTLKGAVLYIHPWAEEMNKSRRMAALASQALAVDGWAVLQIDLLGCGDSSGDFGAASWVAWLDDITRAAHWLQARHPGAPLWLWGLRAGALLSTQVAARLGAPCNFLFWQPVGSGKQFLQQFLRLKATADLQQGDARAILEGARADLAAGRCVEVAGYSLPPALAQGLETATLELPSETRQVVWLETSMREPATLLPASSSRIDTWRAAGHRVHAQAVPGPAFWQTQEIEDAPALLTATTAALQAALAAA